MNWFKRKPQPVPVPAERWVIKHETEHFVYFHSSEAPPTLETCEELLVMGYRPMTCGMLPYPPYNYHYTCEKIK